MVAASVWCRWPLTRPGLTILKKNQSQKFYDWSERLRTVFVFAIAHMEGPIQPLLATLANSHTSKICKNLFLKIVFKLCFILVSSIMGRMMVIISWSELLSDEHWAGTMMMKISLCLTCSDSTRLPGPYMVEKWQNLDDTVSMQIFVFTFKHIEYPIKVQGFGILLTLFLWPLYIYSCCVVIIYGAFSAHFHLTAFINSEYPPLNLRSISTALTSVWVCIHGPGRAKLVLLWKPSGFCFPILISCPKATLVMSYALAIVPSSYS